MNASIKSARLIRIRVEKGKEGLFYATSPELKGLLVAAATTAELEDEIPSAIAEMYAACGVQVLVTPIEVEESGESQPWVAIPTEVALRALSSGNAA